MDLNHFYEGDLQVSPTGDLQLVDSTVMGQQRVLRRLLTTATDPNNAQSTPDYIWHPSYGAGLPKYVGRLVDIAKIRALVRSQIFMEAAVSRNPDPVVTVTAIPNGCAVYIHYNDAVSKKPVTLNFNVNL